MYHDSRIAVIITSAYVQTSGSDKAGVARKNASSNPIRMKTGRFDLSEELPAFGATWQLPDRLSTLKNLPAWEV